MRETARIELWEDVEQLRIVLEEDLEEGPAKLAGPGIRVHYGRVPGSGGAFDRVRYVEIEPAVGRDLRGAWLTRCGKPAKIRR